MSDTKTYTEGQRVYFDGWDTYPQRGSAGTVTRVAVLHEPNHPFAAPYEVAWDCGGQGSYSASMLSLVKVEADVCECYMSCNEGGRGCSHSGTWHTHEGEPCPVHPDAVMVG